MKRIIVFFLGLSFATFASYSKGRCGASFLKIDSLPRPASLGGAFSAISNDLSSLYYNPAGIGQLEVPEEGVTGACEWIEKTKIGIIGYGSPISEENAGLGISLLYLKTDKMPLYKREDSESQEGEFDAEDLSIRVGYGIKFTRSNYFGFVAGFLIQRIEEEESSGFLFDIGHLYKPEVLDRFAFSVVIQNIGKKVKFIREEDELPTSLRIGFSYNLAKNATIVCDLVKPKDNELQTKVGFEWEVNNIFTLRGGYNSQIFKDLGIGITGGFGINVETFRIDYAYVPYNDLGQTHRLSFTTHFGKKSTRH